MIKMKKGFYGPLIIVVALAIILIAEMVTVSTIFKKERTEHRQLLETSLISEADRVETYVRSYLRATDLSSLQSIHTFGEGEIVLPYDSNSMYYSQDYNMSYWQIYDSLIPPREILLNKARQEIGWVSSCLLENYLTSYDAFSSDITMVGVPRPNVESISGGEIIIRQSAADMGAYTMGEFEGDLIKINRDFRPYSIIITRFGDVITKAVSIVDNDLLGQLIRNEIYPHDMSDINAVRTELNNLANAQSGAQIKVFLKIHENSDWEYAADGTSAAIINVMIYDSVTNYSFYNFDKNITKIGFLGVNFTAKVGHKGSAAAGALGNLDEVKADTLTRDCPSGLGIISPSDGICDFFNVTPQNCNDPDPDGYTTKNTCEDFTGEYTDLCFDSDGDGDDDTVYEYDCYLTSEICYYIEYNCPSNNCTEGACTILCSIDSDCDDSNVCTGNETMGGIDVCRNPGAGDAYCESPPLPNTYVPSGNACGTTPRLCGEAGSCIENCQAVGNTWMCDSMTDTVCSNTCDGLGNCNGCTPPACAQEDCGCADDTYCSPGYKCKWSTHECTLDECDSDSDCTDPKSVCQYWTCDRPADPDSVCILNNKNDGDTPDAPGCGEDTRSCPRECKSNFEYSVAVNDEEKCERKCDGSGGCKASCTPPVCSYTSIKKCAYGCKDATNCWQGYFCPAKGGQAEGCGDTCCFPCTGTECWIATTCIREDMSAPTCTWRDRWDNTLCACGAGEWCEWPCCVTDRTCTANCAYSDACTYT